MFYKICIVKKSKVTTHICQRSEQFVHQALVECYDYSQLLQMRFDDGLADKRGSKKGPKRH